MLTAGLATAALLTSVGSGELRRVDPVTLAPAGAPVRLAGPLLGGWTARDGRLALGVTGQGVVQIVDGRRTRVHRTGARSTFWLLSWPQDRRVVALGMIRRGRFPLAVIDPIDGRVVRAAELDGAVVGGVATVDGLALLVAPPDGIGDAALALIDAEGVERRIALPGVPAGSEPPGTNPNPRSVIPGLAVRDGRAYLATDARVVEVDLSTGEQRAHAVFGARAAKRGQTYREVAFVGPHQLAVSGREVPAHGEAEPVGLRLVDTRTWGVKLVARGGYGAAPLPRGGFAAWPSRRGLALFDADGTRRGTALRGRTVVQLQIAGRYGYAVTARPAHRTFVVELSSGRVVKTLPTAQPGRLIG